MVVDYLFRVVHAAVSDLDVVSVEDFSELVIPGGGGTWVNFCWVCAAGLSEPLPHYSLFCGQS